MNNILYRFVKICVLISILFIVGCAVTVTYKSEPPGAIISGDAHGGGTFNYQTPMKLSYPDAAKAYRPGGPCPEIMSPTASWPDGSSLAPRKLQLCHYDSEWTFYKPTQSYQPSYSPNATTQSGTSIEDAKKKCSEIGFKMGTETFGNCVLKLSK